MTQAGKPMRRVASQIVEDVMVMKKALLGAVMLLGLAAGRAEAVVVVPPYTITTPATDGSDCSSTAFPSCSYDESPIIAQYIADGGGSFLYNSAFADPGTFSVINNGGGVWGFWSYAGPVTITAFSIQTATQFAVFTMDAPGNSFTDIHWQTAFAITTGTMTRMSFYDTGVETVPLPAALPLLLAGLAGLGLIGRKARRKAAA